MAGDDERDSRFWTGRLTIEQLEERVRSLGGRIDRVEIGTKDDLSRARSECDDARREVRRELTERVVRVESDLRDWKEETNKKLAAKAENSVVDPMRRNLNSVVMFIIFFFLAGILAVGFVYKVPGSTEHVAAGAK